MPRKRKVNLPRELSTDYYGDVLNKAITKAESTNPQQATQLQDGLDVIYQVARMIEGTDKEKTEVEKLLESRGLRTKIKAILNDFDQKGYNNKEKLELLLYKMTGSFTSGINLGDSLVTGEITLEPTTAPIEHKILRGASRHPIPRALINHRIYQLQEYGRVGDDKTAGFRLTTSDPNQKVTDSDKKELDRYSRLMCEKLFYVIGNDTPNFGEVLGACYNDYFTLGRFTFFVERDSIDKPLSCVLIDPAKIVHLISQSYRSRRIDNDEYEQNLKDIGSLDLEESEYRYALLNEFGRPQGRIPKNRIIEGKFARETDVTQLYRINSILSQGIGLFVDIVRAMAFNSGKISNNPMPEGVFVVPGGLSSISDNDINTAQQKLIQYSQNPEQQHRIPIISTTFPESRIEYIRVRDRSSDVEYYQWTTLLFTILCRLAGADPEELSFASLKGMLQGKAIQREGQEGISKVSERIGLYSFLNCFANAITGSDIVKGISGRSDLRFEPTGFRIEDELKKAQLQQIQLQTVYTVNQILRINDSPETKEDWADIPGIMNPTIFQLYSQKKQQEMMAQQQQQQQGAMGGGQPGGAGAVAGAEQPGAPGQEGGEGAGKPEEQGGKGNEELLSQEEQQAIKDYDEEQQIKKGIDGLANIEIIEL